MAREQLASLLQRLAGITAGLAHRLESAARELHQESSHDRPAAAEGQATERAAIESAAVAPASRLTAAQPVADAQQQSPPEHWLEFVRQHAPQLLDSKYRQLPVPGEPAEEEARSRGEGEFEIDAESAGREGQTSAAAAEPFPSGRKYVPAEADSSAEAEDRSRSDTPDGFALTRRARLLNSKREHSGAEAAKPAGLEGAVEHDNRKIESVEAGEITAPQRQVSRRFRAFPAADSQDQELAAEEAVEQAAAIDANSARSTNSARIGGEAEPARQQRQSVNAERRPEQMASPRGVLPSSMAGSEPAATIQKPSATASPAPAAGLRMQQQGISDEAAAGQLEERQSITADRAFGKVGARFDTDSARARTAALKPAVPSNSEASDQSNNYLPRRSAQNLSPSSMASSPGDGRRTSGSKPAQAKRAADSLTATRRGRSRRNRAASPWPALPRSLPDRALHSSRNLPDEAERETMLLREQKGDSWSG